MIDGRLEDTAALSLELPSRGSLQRVSNIDKQGFRFVGHVVLLLTRWAPRGAASTAHGRWGRACAVSWTPRRSASGPLGRARAGSSLVRQAAVQLHFVPEVVVEQLNDARQERRETTDAWTQSCNS
jgi:hypothetical protein